jgi:hypothetical protein
MILKNAPIAKKQVRLSSPDGNAFVLMGLAGSLAKQLHLNKNEIIADMQSGDYHHLVTVFHEYFGDYVDIIDDINLFD